MTADIPAVPESIPVTDALTLVAIDERYVSDLHQLVANVALATAVAQLARRGAQRRRDPPPCAGQRDAASAGLRQNVFAVSR